MKALSPIFLHPGTLPSCKKGAGGLLEDLQYALYWISGMPIDIEIFADDFSANFAAFFFKVCPLDNCISIR